MSRLSRILQRALVKLAIALLDLPLWALHELTVVLEEAKLELAVQVFK